MRTWVVAALVGCITVGGAHAAVHKAKPSPSRFGIADGGDVQALSGRERRRYLGEVRRAGARWIRIGIYWDAVQRRGPRSYDWAQFDRVVKASRRRGLFVVGTLLHTPRWARAPGTPNTAPPTDLRAFATFAGRVARHFRPRGLHVYEIWNEPNTSGFWSPRPDAARYAQLLRLSYGAIKRADPRAKVISGGLSPYGAYGASDGQHVNPLTFLEQMYANGARGSMDGVGWHPYNFPWGLGYFAWSAWSQMAATSPSARTIMRANGDANKKIWATEWGAPTGTSTQAVSEAGQAQLIATGLARLRAAAWAGPSFLYNFRDKGSNTADREQNFGIVRRDWSRKPGYHAFKRLATKAKAR